MTADSNCRYEIEWVTEYACHRDYLESHNCTLNSEQHDLSIDLTPLTVTCKWILLWRNCTLGFGWIWYWWHYWNMLTNVCPQPQMFHTARPLDPAAELKATSTTWMCVEKLLPKNVEKIVSYPPVRWKRLESWQRWLEDTGTRLYGIIL